MEVIHSNLEPLISENEEFEDNKSINTENNKEEGVSVAFNSDEEKFAKINDDGSIIFSEKTSKMERKVEKIKSESTKIDEESKKQFGLKKNKPKDEPKKESDQTQKLKQAMRKRKLMRYSAYFIYIAMIALGLMAFFKYSIIRNSVYFYNLSNSNPTIKLKVDNCSLYIMDSDENTMSAPIYIQYFMPPGHESGSASVGSQIIAEDSLTVNILNAGDAYYCLAKLFIKADTTPLDSLEITCGKCNITQDTSSQLQINGLFNLTGDSVHANFRNIKVGSFNYKSFTGHLQFNNIESGPEVNNIVMSGEGDIIIQSIQDYVVNTTTNTQAFCFGGTSLASLDNGTCIYSDQEQPVPSRYKNCSLSWSVCISDVCNLNSFPTYVVNSTNGNVYANAIPKVGSPVIPKQIVSGQIYNQGIAFSSTAEEVLEAFDQYVADPDKSNPFVVLNVGDIASRSSKNAKWIVSSVPSYALMKPWWIGTFSGAMLDGYVKGANGILLPGFCPFYPDYITQDLLDMQNLIYTKIATPYTLVTFVVDESMPSPSNYHKNYTGVFPLIEGGNPSDRWFSLGLSAGGHITVENNDYTKKWEILAAIIISLLIVVIVTCYTLKMTCVSINSVYQRLVEFSNHLSNYSKLEKSIMKEKIQEAPKPQTENENDMIIQSVLPSTSSLLNFLKQAPSPLAFIDYLSLIVFRQFSNSVVQFYFLLFKEKTQEDDQELDPNQNMMKGTEVKALYEKFCFMNHFNEQKLTDSVNQDVLRSYGFEISTREDLTSEVFTRLVIKKKTPFPVNSKQLKTGNSLDIYIQENVKLTQFDEDQIELREFIRLYNDFCDYNRLPYASISTSVMREKYGINMNFLTQQYILRIQEPVNFQRQSTTELSFYNRVISSVKNFVNRPKRYVIDKSKLENHFKLLMEETSIMTKEQISSATSDLILYPKWPIWDLITVLLHLLVSVLIVAPLIYFVVLNESQYQPWSLKDNQYLIRYNDFFHDPLQFTRNLYSSFTWNVFLMAMATTLLIVSSFDLMLYYAIMEFPQDKCFKKSQIKVETKFIDRISRQIEWFFVFTAFTLYFGYISLVLIWLLLGAFINPITFLPFASAAVTFVVFVVAKFKAFKDISKTGTKKILGYVTSLFRTFTNNVLVKITKNFENYNIATQQKDYNEPNRPQVLNAPADVITKSEPGSDVPPLDPLEAIEPSTIEEGKARKVLKKPQVTNPKLKKLLKVQKECVKRKFPPQITDLILSIFSQNKALQKKSFQSIIEALNKKQVSHEQKALKEKQALSPESAIIPELIFPQGIKKEETVKYINILIMNHVFEQANMGSIDHLNAEILYELFMMFKELDENNYDRFLESFKQRLRTSKVKSLEQIETFMPILDIAAMISKDDPDHWNIKHSCFKLFQIAGYLLKSKVSEEKLKQMTLLLEKFIKFLPLIFSVFEIPYNIDNPNELLDSKQCLSTIENFCDAIGTSDKHHGQHGEEDKKPFSVADLIYLGISLNKHETNELPRRVIKAVEDACKVDALGTKLLPFCLSMTNALYNKPAYFYERLERSAENFAIPTDLQQFLRIISTYYLKSFDTYHSAKFTENNPYFVKIAQTLKAKPKELLGLLDLVCERRDSKYATYFYQALLTRMDMNPDLLGSLQSLANIFFSQDENTIVRALKTLDLEEYGEFLLIGKHKLDPRFFSDKVFNEVGIFYSAAGRKTIFSDTPEQFSNWKASIRDELTKKVKEFENKYKDFKDKETLQRPEEVEATANLIKFFLSDWKNLKFSKKFLVTAVTALDNPKNQLKAKVMNTELGRGFNGIDFLTRLAYVHHLHLQNGRRFSKLDKDKENALNKLSEYLGFNPEAFGNFMKLFLLNDKEGLVKSLLFFFPKEEKENLTKISKILGFNLAQAAEIEKQLNFINDDFSNNIKLSSKDKKSIVPPGLIKKIYFGAPCGDLDLNDILELVSLKIKKSKFSEELKEELLIQCLNLGLLAKGLVFADKKSNIQIHSPQIAKLIKILSETDVGSKHTEITGMFKSEDNIDHPIKVALALSGLLTHTKFGIQSVKKSEEDNSSEQKVQSVSTYLSAIFKIQPEFFDLFNIVFERDASKFFQKAVPLLRRLCQVPVLDTQLLESLFTLSVGEKPKINNLCDKLGISQDLIEFFVSLIRLSNKSTRKSELKSIKDSKMIRRALIKLEIKPEEFLNLLRLVFNEFDITEESISEIIHELGLKPEEGESGIIQVDFLKGFIAVNSQMNPKLNIFDNKKALAELQAQTRTFWNSIGMIDNKQEGFIISRLAAGNFLVLEDFKDYLGWIFPIDREEAGRGILNLTMGLYGLIHPKFKLCSDLNKHVEEYVKEFYPKENFSFKEPEYKRSSKVLPKNHLPYSIYLTYETLNIPPKWIQAFLFDKEAINSMSTEIPNLNKEFILALVLQFRALNDVVGDLLGLFDWTNYCKSFYKNSKGLDFNSEADEFLKKKGLVDDFFYDKMSFEKIEIKKLATARNLSRHSLWKSLEKYGEYNKKINQCFFYLLTLKDKTKYTKEIKEQLAQTLRRHFGQTPRMFLVKFAEHAPKEEQDQPKTKIKMKISVGKEVQEQESQEKPDTKTIVGKMIREAIVVAYDIINEKMYHNQTPRYPGFAITNFCMLADIMSLRESSNFSFQRKLHCLHQLFINIERMMIFDDVFYRMSKYKMMKILGIAVGMQISNIVEWSLSPSFFDYTYVKQLKEAEENQKQTKSIKEKKCEMILSAYKAKSSRLPKELKDSIHSLGDLGDYGAGYKNYIRKMQKILESETWEEINMALDFDAAYFIHPKNENVMTRVDQMEADEKSKLEKCKVDEEIYKSLELLNPEHPEYDNLDEISNYPDKKTGITYKELIERSLQFEKALINPNMTLILNPAEMLEGDHILNKDDPTKETTKLYMALIGLQSYSMAEKKVKLALSSYLSTLSGYIESDVLALEEIFDFLVTQKANFNHITNKLEFSDEVLNLLLVGVENEKVDDDEDEDIQIVANASVENQKKPHSRLADAAQNIIKTLPRPHLKALDIIRDVYLLKGPKAWINVIQFLRKDDEELHQNVLRRLFSYVVKGKPKDEEGEENVEEGGQTDPHLSFLRKVFSFIGLGKSKQQKQEEPKPDLPSIPHSLEQLVQMIEFKKLRKKIKAGEDKNIMRCMQIKQEDNEEEEKGKTKPIRGEDENEFMCEILERLVLKLGAYRSYNYEMKESLKEIYRTINFLLQKDFSRAFELMILNDKKEIQSKKWINTEKMLEVFGVQNNNNEKDINYFVLFVTFAHSHMGKFRKDDNYSDTVAQIVQVMVDERILDPFKNTSDKAIDELKELSQLTCGALAWDFNLCIKSLGSPETINEGYLLYSLYGFLNLDEVLSTEEKNDSAIYHLKAILPFVYPTLYPKSANIDLLKIYEEIREEDLSSENLASKSENLASKSENLFNKIQDYQTQQGKQPEPLSKRIFKNFEKNSESILTKCENPKFESGRYHVIEDILWSFCDGTILIRLINTLVDHDEKKKQVLKKLFSFQLDLNKFYWKELEDKSVIESCKGLIQSVSSLGNKELWNHVGTLTPNILNILLTVQKHDGPIMDKQKDFVLNEVLELADFGEESLINLLHETTDVMLGTDKRRLKKSKKKDQKETKEAATVQKFGTFLSISEKDESPIMKKKSTRFDEESVQRFDMFFRKVCNEIFPGLAVNGYFNEHKGKIYILLELINLDYLEKMNDKKSRFDITWGLLEIFETLKICSSKSDLEILLNLLSGISQGSEKLIKALDNKLSDDGAKIISEYLQEVQKYLKSKTKNTDSKAAGSSVVATHANKKKIIDNEEWIQIMKKIKEGTTTSRDLFKMVDQEGDNSGTINEAEFCVLAGRLGLKLSDHRIKEIFAKIKGAKVQDADYNELNEEEFEKALSYLEEKNLQQAMELLGITPEILTAILIRLIMLLILIFVFLYLGLKAFAIGGTFGSIVNSIFPIAGGIALGKDKQGEESLDDETVKDATDKGFIIATSGEL